MSEQEDSSVSPGGPLTGAALREVADWLDTYDKMAAAFYSLLEALGNTPEGDLIAARQTSASQEVQNDLRRWADELPS